MNKQGKKEQTSIELLDQILDDNNLYKVYEQVYKNKGAWGIDGMTLEELSVYMFQ